MNKVFFLMFSLAVASAASAAGTYPFLGFYGTYTIQSCQDKRDASEFCKFNTLQLVQSANLLNGVPDIAMDMVMTDNKQGSAGARSTHSIRHPEDMYPKGGIAKYSEDKEKASLYFKSPKFDDGITSSLEMEISREENGTLKLTSKTSESIKGAKETGTDTVMILVKKK